MLSRKSPKASPHELVPLRSNRAKETTVIYECAPPKKIACGNCHTLFIQATLEHEEDPDAPDIMRTRVYGWGDNRHNVLGMKKEAVDNAGAAPDFFKLGDGADGTAPWKTEVPEPTKQVFNEQDPQRGVLDRRKEAREEKDAAKRQKSDPKSALGDRVTSQRSLSNERGRDFGDVFEVSCGNNHSMVLEKCRKDDGDMLYKSRLWSFGLKPHGRLGRGRPGRLEMREADLRGEPLADDEEVESDCDFPGEVMEDPSSWLTGFGDMDVKPVVQRVCCGGDHTLAIVNMMGGRSDRMVCQGRVFAWGLNSYGALGTQQKVDAWVPQEVWFPEEEEEDSRRCITIQLVACGMRHSMALSHEGKVYTWGHAGNGCLGLGRKEARLGSSFTAEFTPKNVTKLAETKITYIAAGESHSGAVDQLGGLHTWGAGAFGRCGHGMVLDVIHPARVESLLGIATGQISFGMMHSLAVTVPGQLYAWGKGAATGLDKGDNEHSSIPTPVHFKDSSHNVVCQVATGPMHSVVLLQDGTLFVFGCGSLHRMPTDKNGRAERRDVACPKKLEDFTGWSKALFDEQRAAGARKGRNSDKPDRDKHPRMPAQISAGGSNSATVLLNGDLWIWGNTMLSKHVEPAPAHNEDEPKGDSDQMGANDPNIWLPQPLKQGLRNFRVSMIAIGQEHALIITDGKQLFAWGQGIKGQLGTGNLGISETPDHVTNISDVICIAAGEEHSACIIDGGEPYSWGNAEGGRLGLGATMNEGVQMLPDQVCIKAKGTKDLRLRSVTCGSQHTCFISDDDRVLACGVGWFGRLGQGSQDYSYSPEFIVGSQNGNLLAHEVKCATYHTCVVDKAKGLWLMGRDNSCCQPAGQHLLSPQKFEPFENPRRYIFAIACSDSHTLAITSQRPDTRHGTELWAWGKNSRGQLGISEAEAPYIDLPWQLRIPGEGAEWHKFTKVATSSWHSLLVVEGKGQNSNHFDVYSWGFSGSGRLGQKFAGELEGETKDVDSTEALAKPGHPLVRPPRKVDVRWKPPVTVESQKRESADDDGDGPTARKFEELLQLPCKAWLDVQIRLHAEDPENKKARLLEASKKVGTTYTDFMNDILGLWDKPPAEPFKYTEWHLRQKQREVESQYIRTLEVLSLTNSVHAPRIEALVKTEDEVKQKLYLFEELFWILQQQPLYLTNLSCHVWGKKRDERECLIFHHIVSRLFNNLRESRTRNLFKALVRSMIEAEMAKAIEAAELFDPVKSRVSPLFTQMCTNPYFMQSIANPILDPELSGPTFSLMHIIIKYTLTKDSHNVRNKRHWLGGIFATNQLEYGEREKYYRKKNYQYDRSFAPRTPDEDGKGRQYFQDELKDFAKLLNGLGGKDVPFDKEVANEDEMTPEELRKRFDGVLLLDLHAWRRMRKERLYSQAHRTEAMEDELRHRVMAALHGPDWEKELQQTLCLDVPFIKDFIGHFVKNILGGNAPQARDFQMLLVHTYQTLVKQKFVMQFKSTERENAWQPELLAPIASIVIANIIGGVLFAIHNKEGPFALMRKKIEKYVVDLEDHMLAGKDAKDRADLKDRNLIEKVWWNVEHLALFFERCVHKNVYDFQKKDKVDVATADGSKPRVEEALAKDAAKDLKDHTCNALMGALQDRAGEIGGYSKDETETQLTVDLYTSHYSMAKHYISVSTSDMLQLTNILDKYMEPDMRNQNNSNPPIRTDTPENDRVCKLIKAILPKEANEQGQVKAQARVVPWSSGYIAIAQKAGEMHNFTMPARFLEFARDGPEEPTFCTVTQAPMPRSLCKEDQKKRSGVRVVKPLRDDRGPEYDLPPIGSKVYPYEELLLLFDTLSGSSKGERGQPHVPYNWRIKGNSFTSLSDSFVDIQTAITGDMDANTSGPSAGQNAELLQRLENGKIFVSKISESMEEKDLREFMERELRKRNEYRAYLTSLSKGTRQIQEAQEAYRKKVKETYNKLEVLNTMSELCEMPEEITGAMQLHSERPKFGEAKKLKARKVNTDPTPARKVLDQLIRSSGDSGKQNMEKLKEMVGCPARTYTKAQLEKKGVLVQVNDLVPNHVRKDMKFTFQFDNESYNVRVSVRTTLLREFVISRQDIELLTAGRKNTIMSYGDDFVWVHCFRLRRLLAFIMAEGGL